MLRSFCVGAMVGFLLGSSKQGLHLRDIVDGFITSLLKADEDEKGGDKSSKKDFSTSTPYSFGARQGNGNGHTKNGGSKRTETPAPERTKSASAVIDKEEAPATKSGETGVTVDKMQELADALNVKPTTPETDELEPGHHPNL